MIFVKRNLIVQGIVIESYLEPLAFFTMSLSSFEYCLVESAGKFETISLMLAASYSVSRLSFISIMLL